MVFFTEASFVVLCAGIYQLGRLAFTPLVGLAAAGILCTRFDFPFLAARAYIDIPYLAFVVWAAALELARPRRGGIVWVLLACAGLLRPGGVADHRPVLPVDVLRGARLATDAIRTAASA